jgi:putative pre-16S rRNA nuclease
MTIASLDFGKRRIGLAIAYGDHSVVIPLEVIERKSLTRDLASVVTRLVELQVSRVIVGLPLNMDGTSGVPAQRAARFADQLHEASGIVVELFDERLTSFEAQERLRGTGGRRRHGGIDAIAAAIILESWLGRA